MASRDGCDVSSLSDRKMKEINLSAPDSNSGLHFSGTMI